jgi:hypothetical protein
MTQSEIAHYMGEEELALTQEKKRAPERVKSLPRLRDDIEALHQLTCSDKPPKRTIRPCEDTSVVYTFGDASGSGFGGSSLFDNEVQCYGGQWEDSYAEELSNHRELANLVLRLERDIADGRLKKLEVFVFTDNSTAESAFFKGTSKSRNLFELILQLQVLHFYSGILLQFVHVAGKRMIAQGADGLLRVSRNEGVMQGKDFLSFVLLHLSVVDRQPTAIQEWVQSWFGAPGKMEWLTQEGWYTQGYTLDWCIWTPPPAAADAALEQLAKWTHKRPKHTHLVLIPRLMTAMWRKLLLKICDVVFTVPIGTSVWNDSQCEPLIAGLYLPLSRHPPWKLKRTILMAELEGELFGLQKDAYGWSGFILQKFLQQTRSLERMLPSLVREVLQGTG